MVVWGVSSLLFLRELGYLLSGLYAAPLQQPRFPLRETLYCPRIDPPGAKEVEWVGRLRWARAIGKRQGLSPYTVRAAPSRGQLTGLLLCAGQASLTQESGPSVSRPGSV